MNGLTTDIVDTHAHICDGAFDDDRPAVLARAQEAGVRAIVAVGEDVKDARRNLELADEFGLLRPAAGLYPAYAGGVDLQEMTDFIRASRPRLAAIGEVGLDFWLAKTEKEKNRQRNVFKAFIALSLELDLPLNVHSRSAGRHAVTMLLEGGARRVQLHAFDGKIAAARPALEAGYYFSMPPSLVRSRQKQKLLKHLPLDSLLLETDSPVLGADPHQRNEPAHLPVVVQAIAEIKHIPPEDIIAAVNRNTYRLYKL